MAVLLHRSSTERSKLLNHRPSKCLPACKHISWCENWVSPSVNDYFLVLQCKRSHQHTHTNTLCPLSKQACNRINFRVPRYFKIASLWGQVSATLSLSFSLLGPFVWSSREGRFITSRVNGDVIAPFQNNIYQTQTSWTQLDLYSSRVPLRCDDMSHKARLSKFPLHPIQ